VNFATNSLSSKKNFISVGTLFGKVKEARVLDGARSWSLIFLQVGCSPLCSAF